jgi:DNA-binding GntR family transcriptional regulator
MEPLSSTVDRLEATSGRVGLPSDPRSLLMVKDSVAAVLREEIFKGGLQPGMKIVEGKWAKRLGVAQSSIREAINTLVIEGIIEKGSGRSARVTLLGEDQINQIYQFRAVLEGFAARLVAEQKADLSDLEQLIADMRAAIDCGNIQAFYERDLRFHMRLCEKSGNRYLEQSLHRLIVPLFAFVVIRLHARQDGQERWERSIEQHRQMLQAIQSGDPLLAEQQVRHSVNRFFSQTNELLAQRRKE